MDAQLLGKCGFYCGSCPTYLQDGCLGCMKEHQKGDCFSRDCVLEKGLSFCGECRKFPCDTILNEPHTTVLDKEWLQWKKASSSNR